jgi:hypothetical protein
MPIMAAPGVDVVDAFWEKHSGEILILAMTLILMATLLIVVPQLLKANQRTQEMRHEEHLKALENGQSLPPFDVRSRAAGRTTALVPMVALISAATVTCFLVAYKSEVLFSVTVAAWSVAGLVSLAAVTGGVALLGRLAQLDSGLPDEDEEGEEASS